MRRSRRRIRVRSRRVFKNMGSEGAEEICGPQGEEVTGG
jgi:hypothetical protein